MSKDAEEVLEKLWVYLDGNNDDFIQRDLVGETVLKELEDLDLVEYDDGKVHLTPKGFEESGRIIRGFKLSLKSEKVFSDVLGVNMELKSLEGPDSGYAAENIRKCTCNFSNQSGSYIEDEESSCGCGGSCRCAEKITKIIEDTSLPLSKVKEGQSCKVVYIKSAKCENLRKILSMGVLPGMAVKIIQKRPSHVFIMEDIQISVDTEIAESIYVGALDE